MTTFRSVVAALSAVLIMGTVAVATVRPHRRPIAIAQDAGVPVRDQLNQLLDEACEVHGCADAGVEQGQPVEDAARATGASTVAPCLHPASTE